MALRRWDGSAWTAYMDSSGKSSFIDGVANSCSAGPSLGLGLLDAPVVACQQVHAWNGTDGAPYVGSTETPFPRTNTGSKLDCRLAWSGSWDSSSAWCVLWALSCGGLRIAHRHHLYLLRSKGSPKTRPGRWGGGVLFVNYPPGGDLLDVRVRAEYGLRCSINHGEG